MIDRHFFKAKKLKMDPTQNLVAGLSEFLKMKVEDRHNTRPGTTETLEYYSMYLNLDRMLKKLPTSVVEDLNVKYVQLALGEIKKHDPAVVIHLESVQ